jgi:hypothetical protein
MSILLVFFVSTTVAQNEVTFTYHNSSSGKRVLKNPTLLDCPTGVVQRGALPAPHQRGGTRLAALWRRESSGRYLQAPARSLPWQRPGRSPAAKCAARSWRS